MIECTAVTLTIGDYSFDPVPTVAIDKNWNRSESGCPLSVTKSAVFSGLILAPGCKSCSNPEEQTDIIGLYQEMDQNLCQCNQCVKMTLTCGENSWIDTYVRVLSVSWSESADNWAATIPFNMTVEWDEDFEEGSDCCKGLRSASDTWSFEYLESPSQYLLTVETDVPMAPPTTETCDSGPRFLSVSHAASASAVDCCEETVTAPMDPDDPPVVTVDPLLGWKIAEKWVCERSGFNEDVLLDLKGFGFDSGNIHVCNHAKTVSYDKKSGTYSLNETFIISSEETKCCTEEWSIECSESNQTNLSSFTISGTIRGFEVRDPDDFDIITTTKIESAKACWENVKDELASRIACCYDVEGCPINDKPLSKALTFSPTAGTVTYSYSFDNRRQSLIAGTCWEDISFNDTKPSENISQVAVLGRQQGPILSRCNTQNARSKTLNMQVLFPRTDCPELMDCAAALAAYELSETQEMAVDDFVCCVEQSIIDGMSDDYFIGRTEDTCSINIETGVYTRNVTWIYQDCQWRLPVICEE